MAMHTIHLIYILYESHGKFTLMLFDKDQMFYSSKCSIESYYLLTTKGCIIEYLFSLPRNSFEFGSQFTKMLEYNSIYLVVFGLSLAPLK